MSTHHQRVPATRLHIPQFARVAASIALLVDAVPADQAPTLSAELGLAPRTDGPQQLTYQSAPLYYFVGDAQPGDTNGQGSGGVWFVVSASSSASASTTAAAPGSPPVSNNGY